MHVIYNEKKHDEKKKSRELENLSKRKIEV